MSIVYKADMVTERMGYEEAQKSCKMDPRYHLGQLKLFMSEIMFLSKVSKPGDLVVYVGAAPGYHTHKIAELFPDLEFELWDPRDYDILPRDNIKTYTGFFTDDDAREYANRSKNTGKEILLISDIRNADIGKVRREKDKSKMLELDIQVIGDDMRMQMDWCRIIRPRWAFMKFRLPYKPGKTMYLTGKRYIQTYSPLSTEIRILTNNYDDTKEYDNVESDERMAYFNCNIRFAKLDDHRWDDVMGRHKVKKSWDNYIAFYELAYYLEKRDDKVPDDEKVYELFDDVITFHRDKYGKKYDHLYEK